MDATEKAESLSAERIVRAAVELADEEGLAGLSIRKLGQRLEAGTMAAYRHVESKDALVALMVDAALGSPGSPFDGTWQQRVAGWAQGMSGRYREHPWLIDAPISGAPTTVNRALWLERILQALEPTGLGLQQLLDCALLIDGHVRSTAYLVREISRSAPPPAASAPLDADQFPLLSRVMSSGVLDDDDEQTVDFGLARIMAGIEQLAASAPR